MNLTFLYLISRIGIKIKKKIKKNKKNKKKQELGTDWRQGNKISFDLHH